MDITLQLAALLQAPASTAGGSPLANFLLAGAGSNSAFPDFKSLAASFFADTEPANGLAQEGKAGADAVKADTSTPEAEGEKDKGSDNSSSTNQLPATNWLLSAITVPVPVVPDANLPVKNANPKLYAKATEETNQAAGDNGVATFPGTVDGTFRKWIPFHSQIPGLETRFHAETLKQNKDPQGTQDDGSDAHLDPNPVKLPVSTVEPIATSAPDAHTRFSSAPNRRDIPAKETGIPVKLPVQSFQPSEATTEKNPHFRLPKIESGARVGGDFSLQKNVEGETNVRIPTTKDNIASDAGQAEAQVDQSSGANGQLPVSAAAHDAIKAAIAQAMHLSGADNVIKSGSPAKTNKPSQAQSNATQPAVDAASKPNSTVATVIPAKLNLSAIHSLAQSKKTETPRPHTQASKAKDQQESSTSTSPSTDAAPQAQSQDAQTPTGDGQATNHSSTGVTTAAAGAHTKADASPDASNAQSARHDFLFDNDSHDDSMLGAREILINAAKLVQGLSQSEFRVGMQSREFGNIDIRTAVAHHVFTAQISTEHNDVAKSLATELPALYDRLADQKIPVGNILVHHQDMSMSSNSGQNAQQQASSPRSNGYAGKTSVEPILPAIVEAAAPGNGRLDIRI